MATGPVPKLVSVAGLPQFDTGAAAGSGQTPKIPLRSAPLGKRFLSAAPQIDLALAAGFAMLFGVHLASTNAAQGAEYQFGTHAAAIYDGQFKGAIFPAALAPATPKPAIPQISAAPQTLDLTLQGFVTPPTVRQGVLTFPVAAAPQTLDLTIQGWTQEPQIGRQGLVPALEATLPQVDGIPPTAFLAPVAATAPLPAALTPKTLIGQPQADPTQPAAVITQPVASGQTPPRITTLQGAPQLDATQIAPLVLAPLVPPPVPGAKPIGLTQGAPQADPSQSPASVFTPLTGARPRVIALIMGAPQADPTQLAAQLLPSLRTPPIVPNPIAGFWVTLPQFEERVTQAVLPAVRAGQLPPRISPLAGSPQSDTSQPAALVIGSARTPPIIPNPIAGFVATLPQFEERVTQAIYPSLRAGQRPPVFTAILAGPQSVDLTLQADLTEPLVASGKVPALTWAAPQDWAQIPAQFWILPTQILTPPHTIQRIAAAPQTLDLTLQGIVWGTPSGRQARVPPLVRAAPEPVDYLQRSLWLPSAPLKSAFITGSAYWRIAAPARTFQISARARRFTASAPARTFKVTMPQVRFDTKDPSEAVRLTFDFTAQLAALPIPNVLLTGVTSVTIANVFGGDTSLAQNGAAALAASQLQAVVPIIAGLAENDYSVRVVVSTSDSLTVLELTGVLPVRS